MHFGKRQVHLLMKQSAEQPIDPNIERQMQKHRASGLGWRYDGLSDWTTEAIIDKLRELGVDTSAERFPDQATTAGRCAVLEANWLEDLELEGFWKDFPFLAAEELWARLTPNLLCPEILSNRLEAAVSRSRANRGRVISEEEQSEVDTAMAVADFLEGFPKEDRSPWFQDIVDCGTSDYGSWLLELVLCSGPRYPDELTYVANVMSDCENAEQYQGDLSLALAKAGRRREALDRVDLNLERFPEDVWVRIISGDVYAEIGDPETAIEFYVTALTMVATPYDWEGVAERLEPVLHKRGRDAEWANLKRRYPKPDDRLISPLPAGRGEVSPAAHDPSGPIGVVTSGPSPRIVTAPAAPPLSSGKVGRNDPCPCGSGKKYKKCCLGRVPGDIR